MRPARAAPGEIVRQSRIMRISGGLMFRTLSAIGLLLACAASAHAQLAPEIRSHTGGVFLNAHLNGSAMSVEDGNTTESGGGIGFGVGYGFTPSFAVFLNLDAAAMTGADNDPDYSLGHLDLGGRYTFGGSAARWRPSIDAGVGVRVAIWDDMAFGQSSTSDVELSGTSLFIGGGLGYYFSPSLALNMGLRLGFGSFSDMKIGNMTISLEGDDRISATTTRFNVGLAWYPSGRSAVALQR
jgi:hypothetical protein